MIIILLTDEQANDVRGPTSATTYIDPIPLKGGGFFLPERVLEDPANAEIAEHLAGLPRRALDAAADLINDSDG